MHDLVIIGAGPAGMAAAIEARSLGLDVAVIDEQASPGGQIYRGVEAADRQGRSTKLGADYHKGVELASAFRACGALYYPGLQVWQLERDGQVYVSDGRATRVLRAKRVLIAVGAMERPVPIPGWTLPGVMTVGGAQIIHKTTGSLPGDGVWIAGCGPLALYYASEVLSAGGRLAGFLDTTPPGSLRTAVGQAGPLFRGWRDALKGLTYMARIKFSGIRWVRGVERVEALGADCLSAVRWRVAGRWEEAKAGGLLLHEGVVPQTHMTMSAGCQHDWDEAQRCFRPRADDFGRTDVEAILVAGDCARISGAWAARCKGRLSALAAAHDLGRLESAQYLQRTAAVRAELSRHEAIRPLLDALYRPALHLQVPDDSVTVCRCEGLSARAVRDAVALGARGPNQAKAYTRCGMGPCQGRLCALTVTTLIADATASEPEAVGSYRIRPPLKPLSLGELASLDEPGVKA